MKVLVVVDMQKDFVDGALGTKEAVSIVPEVVRKIKSFEGEVVYTLDTHTEEYLTTEEGKNLPVVHCIKGSDGWKLVPEIEYLQKQMQSKVFEKPSFGSVLLCEYVKKLYESDKLEEIELVGLCTDICVISNALMVKAVAPEVPIVVDAICTEGVTPESKQNALVAMKMCQIKIKNE